MTGDIKFNRLVKIEGSAEGKIVAPPDASLIVCKGGSFTGDLVGLGMVYVDGKVTGTICVSRCFLGPHAVVRGDIQCRQLSVSATASIIGRLNVSPSLDVKAGLDRQEHLVDDQACPSSSSSSTAHAKPSSNQTSTPEGQTWLVVLEPQADFYPGGEWFAGAQAGPSVQFSLTALTAFLQAHQQAVQHIVVLLDVHHAGPEQAEHWVDAQGHAPPAGTTITPEHLQEGIWRPVEDDEVQLPSEGVVIQRRHCGVGSSGAAVAGQLQKALSQWVNLHHKDVHYLMPSAGHEQGHRYDLSIVTQGMGGDDRVFLCGQLRSHCHPYSLVDLAEQLCSKGSMSAHGLSVLRDGVAEVHHVQGAGAEGSSRDHWAELSKLGVQLVTSTDIKM